MNDSVITTYSHIADEFSNSRYRAWPAVASFIDSFNENSINGDIGCGNGKNMLYRSDIKFEGIDLCDEFIKICNKRNLSVKKGNILDIPYEDNYFDNVISIAVIHHFDKRSDRIKAIKELLRITKLNGKIMIYVWAYEQPEDSKRRFNTQDEMVPYKTQDNIYYRYYHLYKKNELEEEIRELENYKIIKSEYEKGNCYVIIEKV
jgi:ubiquinone/menaquinone biosynthesis C-methylase UbiE